MNNLMPKYFILSILIPFIGFLVTLFLPRKNEKLLYGVTIGTIGVHTLGFFACIVYWLMSSQSALYHQLIQLYDSPTFEFSIDFYFDKISVAYMLVSCILVFLVSIFSKPYLHRDPGFKRFFNTLLLFYFSLNIVSFSGNFETILVGWEILGITSFLLIGFYRDRFLPVKNALKVISIYRLGDICLLLGIWLCHHLWHENVNFYQLANSEELKSAIFENYQLAFIISILFIITASIKSAQIPFSSWLPRAMEGPTTSSAIFYGSLSVHIGVFLLLRTQPFWENLPFINVVVGIIGLITSLIANRIANVQSTVKTQIAYSSITQIGIIFIEVALGLNTIALIHFAGNAFLRTYQLLVSPSVLSYLIHDQFFNFQTVQQKNSTAWIQKLKNTVYILSIKEWNFDTFQGAVLWTPMKWLGKQLAFLTQPISFVFLTIFYILGLYFFTVNNPEYQYVTHAFTLAFSLLGMLLIIRSFAERGDARSTWLLITASQLFIALSISLNEQIEFIQIIIFLSGILGSSLLGLYCLFKLKQAEGNIDLNSFHGHIYEYRKLGFVFLLASLGLIGFPLTPTFLGIDMLFSHIHPQQFLLTLFTSIGFIFIEISVLRVYSRLFLGPHIKNYHEIAYRTS